MQNGDVYVYGVGSYNGTNPSTASTLQSVLNAAGGKGIQSITTTQNGDIIITLENGDVITIDLTHTHTNYLKYQYCTSEADYMAIQNKDSNTLYLISEI